MANVIVCTVDDGSRSEFESKDFFMGDKSVASRKLLVGPTISWYKWRSCIQTVAGILALCSKYSEKMSAPSGPVGLILCVGRSTKYIYKEYHSVCSLVEIETLPPPLSSASVPLPPEPKGGGRGGHTRLRMRGWGEIQFRRLEKRLSTAYSVGQLDLMHI